MSTFDRQDAGIVVPLPASVFVPPLLLTIQGTPFTEQSKLSSVIGPFNADYAWGCDMWDASLRLLFILHRLRTQYISRSVWAFSGQLWPLLQRSKAEELRIYWRRFFPVTTRILRCTCYSTYSKHTLDYGRKFIANNLVEPNVHTVNSRAEAHLG